MEVPVEVFETKKFKLSFYSNSLMELLIKEGVTLDVELLKEIKNTSEKYKPHIKKFYVLIEGTGFFNVKKEVRKLSAKKRFSSRASVVAVYTKKPYAYAYW